MITFTAVNKSYLSAGQPTQILRGVSLDIPQGKLAVVTGRSGSGKSTLLNLLAGLDRPDSGEITIAGRKISSLNAEEAALCRLQQIGIVFQFFNLLPTLTLRENVSLPGHLLGLKRKEIDRRAAENLERVGMLPHADRLPNEVSGGEIQRTAIARALMNRPSVLLADEPTGNLDRTNGETVQSIFLNLAREHNTTVLIVTHDPLLARDADIVVTLNDGEVVH